MRTSATPSPWALGKPKSRQESMEKSAKRKRREEELEIMMGE